MRLCASLVAMVSLMLTVSAVADEKDSDAKKILGKWKPVKMMRGGEDAPARILKSTFQITKDEIIIDEPDGDKETVKYKLDASKKPKQIDVSPNNDEQVVGIYEIDGDTLKFCMVEKEEGKRPTKFESPKGSKIFLMILKRVKE